MFLILKKINNGKLKIQILVLLFSNPIWFWAFVPSESLRVDEEIFLVNVLGYQVNRLETDCSLQLIPLGVWGLRPSPAVWTLVTRLISMYYVTPLISSEKFSSRPMVLFFFLFFFLFFLTRSFHVKCPSLVSNFLIFSYPHCFTTSIFFLFFILNFWLLLRSSSLMILDLCFRTCGRSSPLQSRPDRWFLTSSFSIGCNLDSWFPLAYSWSDQQVYLSLFW